LSVFELPGLNLSIKGTPRIFQIELEHLFQLCSNKDVVPDVTLQATAVPFPLFQNYLSRWICRQLDLNSLGQQPSMLKGPDGNMAIAVRIEGVPYCAWTNKPEKKIYLVSALRNGAYRSAPVQSILMPLLRELLLGHEYLLIHGASVVTPDNVGLLFIAPSRGGKTTTMLSVLRQGGRMIADDLSVFCPPFDTINIRGIPKLLNIRKTTAEFYPELGAHYKTFTKRPNSISRFVSPKSIYGASCVQSQAVVRCIYFIEISRDGPKAIKVSTADAMRKLILANAFIADQPIIPEAIVFLSKIISQTQTYYLKTGSEPAKLGKWLIDHSSRHACA